MRRSLSLNKEVLGELTTMELSNVMGAALTNGGICDKVNTLGLDCTIPTCGALCTGTSTTGLESLGC
jgi:hypothetical protein